MSSKENSKPSYSSFNTSSSSQSPAYRGLGDITNQPSSSRSTSSQFPKTELSNPSQDPTNELSTAFSRLRMQSSDIPSQGVAAGGETTSTRAGSASARGGRQWATRGARRQALSRMTAEEREAFWAVETKRLGLPNKPIKRSESQDNGEDIEYELSLIKSREFVIADLESKRL